MVKPKLAQKRSLYVPVMIGMIILIIFGNLTILFYLQVQVRTIVNARRERELLQKTNESMQRSVTEYNQYKNRITELEEVFPGEEYFPDFINRLEDLIKLHTNEYVFRFSSLTPLAEQEKLYLVINLNVKTDFVRLLSLLEGIEQLPYMTHVISISSKNSQGFSGEGEATIVLKVYVKKPFSTK
jgi:hypothetical protein